ncbi:MAG: VWA domain-containing protein [Gammaproteobacteria bacterium]|nr:VWA domain-containing protein [Gammaproteobacteria bacterium]
MIEQFHFLRPAWLLLLLPWLWVLWRLRRDFAAGSGWRRVVDERLLPFVLSNSGRAETRWTRRLLGTATLCMILALAGPTWERVPQPVYHNQAALVILLDLSRSMDAADLRPSRLARARLKIADILRQRVEGQTALAVYAADAFTVTPLTDDVETVLALLPGLDSSLMPAQGSRADRALALAFELFDGGGIQRGDVLLISDGLGDLELVEISRLLQQQSQHRLSVLAVGTSYGGPVPLPGGGFLQRADGSVLVSTLNESPLRTAAREGGGVYAVITNNDIDINTLGYLLESRLDEREARETDRYTEQWRELGPWLLLLALPLAALAFRRGALLLLPLCLLLVTPRADALDWNSWWRNDDQRALQRFEREQFGDAAELFREPNWRGGAQYRAGDYAAALESWQQRDDAIAAYNRGNALAALGRYEDAIEAYDELLRRDPTHADARYNKQQIEDWLRRQREQQQQQQQQQAGQQQGDGQQQQGQGQSSSAPESAAEAGQAQDETGGEPQPQPGDESASEQARAEAEATGEQQSAEPADEAGEQPAGALADLDRQMSQQATEQWLRKIPDDPGGLLRRKFLYQYRERGGVSREDEPW